MTSKNVKYKCPFCDERYLKIDLVSHINDIHEDMVNEEYTALRIVFNTVNKKPFEYNGKCTECGGPTGWDENKGRYNRICSNPKCKKSYLEKFEKNMKDKLGVTRISSTAEGQIKMLNNRKISGKYKFQDGSEKTYVGKYEKDTLEFLDKIMHCNSIDVITPGPVFEYKYKGENHIYISDMYYQPYNLIIEVKDGGDKPNGRDMKEYREKQIEKENYIIKNTNYNYIRLTNNDLSQLLAVFMDLKMQLVDESNDRVIHINEISNILNEGLLFDYKDIYYNKDKFLNGDINLCIIIGLSGSGKSSMSRSLEKYDIEHIDLDDAIDNYRFDDEKLKSKPKMFKEFFKGPGKKYRVSLEESLKSIEYETNLTKDFMSFAKSYANNHKNQKFIVEGVWIFYHCNPEDYDKYAVYIKGTSWIKSRYRAMKRDSRKNYKGDAVKSSYGIRYKQRWMETHEGSETKLDRWYKYYKTKTSIVREAMNALMSGYIPGFNSTGSTYIVNYMQNNTFALGITDNPKLTNIITRNDEGKLVKMDDNFKDTFDSYNVYLTNKSSKEVSEALLPYMNTVVNEGFIYESIFNKKMFTYDQIELEENAIKIVDYYTSLNILGECVKNIIKPNENIFDDYISFKENNLIKIYKSLSTNKIKIESKYNPDIFIESNTYNESNIKAFEYLLMEVCN